MYEPLRRQVLALLKVPPEPHPPAGDPASLQVFRAGKNYFRLRLTGWAFAQLLALFGFLFWTAILIDVEQVVHERRNGAATPAAAAGGRAPGPSTGANGAAVDTRDPATSSTASAATKATAPAEPWQKRLERSVKNVAGAAERSRRQGRAGDMFGWLAAAKDSAVEFALLFPAGIFPWVWAIKIFSFTLYLLQIPLTYAIRRLDYEMRWYLVTDRSLRLRHGVWKVNESTMSFANVQQVEVSQGPMQRLLGLADVKVQSAGGGSNPQHPQTADDMHVGLFHSVTNAPEIRDLIADRLRRYREAGLGDPDEKHQTLVDATDRVLTNAATTDVGTLAAARALAEEARALRQTLAKL